jgi:hypothetical protein
VHLLKASTIDTVLNTSCDFPPSSLIVIKNCFVKILEGNNALGKIKIYLSLKFFVQIFRHLGFMSVNAVPMVLLAHVIFLGPRPPAQSFSFPRIEKKRENNKNIGKTSGKISLNIQGIVMQIC